MNEIDDTLEPDGPVRHSPEGKPDGKNWLSLPDGIWVATLQPAMFDVTVAQRPADKPLGPGTTETLDIRFDSQTLRLSCRSPTDLPWQDQPGTRAHLAAVIGEIEDGISRLTRLPPYAPDHPGREQTTLLLEAADLVRASALGAEKRNIVLAKLNAALSRVEVPPATGSGADLARLMAWIAAVPRAMPLHVRLRRDGPGAALQLSAEQALPGPILTGKMRPHSDHDRVKLIETHGLDPDEALARHARRQLGLFARCVELASPHVPAPLQATLRFHTHRTEALFTLEVPAPAMGFDLAHWLRRPDDEHRNGIRFSRMIRRR